MAHKRTAKLSRVAKVKALVADRGATAGERLAAEAALERMPVPIAPAPAVPATVSDGQREPLTDPFVRRLPIPTTGSTVHWDKFAGFGIRINAGGGRVFFFNYRTKTGRQRRYTIGSHPSWTVGAARIEAHRLKRLVDQGKDPLGEIQERQDAPTVDDLIERFVREHLSRRRESTRADYEDMIEDWIAPALGKRKVAEVTYSDIDRLHRKISNAGFSYRANRVLAVLSKMFTLGINWNMRSGRDGNPCQGVERNKEYLRRRYLQDDELARLVKALAAHSEKSTADAIRLLLMTGARRGEVLAMRWADVDLIKGLWSKPPSSTKQKEWHTVPLSALAQQLLSELRDQQSRGRRGLPEFVFPSSSRKGHIVEIKRSWRHICKTAGLKDLRIHDLRHSFASALVSDGASLPLIGALLGHANPSTTQRYAHLFDSPMRKAVERVGATIEAAANGSGSEIPNNAAAPAGRTRRAPRHQKT